MSRLHLHTSRVRIAMRNVQLVSARARACTIVRVTNDRSRIDLIDARARRFRRLSVPYYFESLPRRRVYVGQARISDAPACFHLNEI